MNNSLNLGGSLQGTIDNMLTGSVAGEISFAGGTPPVIQEKNIIANGTYTAPSGVDGFSPVVVNVPSKIEGTLIATENGTFTPEDSNHVWNEAIINVPERQPVIQEKSITANGTYAAPSGVDGFSPVVVNVPQPIDTQLSVTQNGVYIPAEGYKYSRVEVNVPSESIYFEPLTPASMQAYRESAMSYTQDVSTHKIDFVWNGGGSVGCSLNGVYNLRGFNSIEINVDEIGSCYSNGSYDRFNFNVGITSEIFNTFVLLNYNTQNKLIDYAIARYSEYYGQSFHDTIEIPADTDCYLYIACNGVNAEGVQIKII